MRRVSLWREDLTVQSRDPAILLYAQNIIDAPDEWTPNYTRSELLPMARAYVAEVEQEKAAEGRVRGNLIERINRAGMVSGLG